MKKVILLLLIFGSFLRMNLRADEGMWIPMLVEKLNYADMKKLGLQLSPEEIYSINNGSLKDAIVIFGRGCTGEIISDQGLVLTNHHCGYGSIQSVSSVENNYLKDGFWAKNHGEEIPVSGLTVQFLVSMEDVTAKILDGLNASTPEKERAEKISERSKEIVKSITEGTHYNAIVKDYYEGNEFYVLVYETFKDIRLVGTPPESIGKFGSDTDNWMWPRHTGDFSMFRVYAGVDNKPAEYSADNKPFKPRHFLPISIDGVKKDDFAMIMGNPGSTDRYLTSYGVAMAVNETNPTRVKIRAEKLRIMDEGMEKSSAVRLKYASKYAGVANYWKYFIGQTRGLKRLDVVEKKQRIEKDFTARIETDANLMKKYGNALPMIEGAYKTLADYNVARWYMSEAIIQGSELLGNANRFNKLEELLLAKPANKEAVNKETDRLKKNIESTFKNYDESIDEALLARMLQMFYTDVPVNQQPSLLRTMAADYKNDFNALARDVFAKSNFTSAEKTVAFLNNPKVKTLSNDPAYKLIRAFMKANQQLQEATQKSGEELKQGNRLFIAGLREMQPERTFYPNANFSLRLTYGTVQDYYPADAIHYDYTTTTKGILEKEDPSVWEFEVPAKLKKMIETGDYGQYGNPDGSMTVNFLTNHDITGGNSGSPVIDGKGQLIGLAFDGNWEAMSGDIAFEPSLQRTISVDIRYVLLIVDKFAGATNLIKEMNIVKDNQKKKEISMPVQELKSVE